MTGSSTNFFTNIVIIVNILLIIIIIITIITVTIVWQCKQATISPRARNKGARTDVER